MADLTHFKYARWAGLYFRTDSSFQILGNENRGKRLVVAKLWGGDVQIISITKLKIWISHSVGSPGFIK